MNRQLILAHDLGTSGDKACLFDISGSFVADAYHQYKTHFPAEGFAEHDPRTWWEAVKASTKEVILKANARASEIKAISFSAHGMGVIPVDRNGNLLVERVMVWMDARSTKEAQHILEKVGVREHYELTGNSFDLALYPAAKILWLRHNMPDIYANTYKFLSTKEYLIHKMTGNIRYTDYGEAGMSGLYNLNTHQWDPRLLEVSEIDEAKLLEPCDGTQIVGELTQSAALEMGLDAGTTVVQGSWDNYASGTGGGVRVNGQMVVCLGTAGWMGINADKPLMDKNFMSNVVYVGNDTYFTTAHSHAACVANDWVLDHLCTNLMDTKEGHALAQSLAEKVVPGSNKLFFMPSMFSGNTFYSDAALCGTFVGLKTMHTQAHVIRAAMEGVGFDLMMGSDFFKRLGVLPEHSSIIGGGANNPLWCEIIASMAGMNMTRPVNQQHIGALGAALMAGVGTGLIKDFDVANAIMKPDAHFAPRADWTKVYEKLLPIYKVFYEQLLPAYRDLQSIQA